MALRVKIPIGTTKLEAEGDTESELEMAVRVALRVASTVSDLNESTPSRSRVPAAGTKPTSNSATWPGEPPNGYVRPKYRRVKSNRERLRLALADLAMNFGVEHATANQIIRHLESSGGTFKSRAKDRAASARQIFRTDEFIIGTGSGYAPTSELLSEYAPLLWGGPSDEASGATTESQPEAGSS